MNRNWRLGIEHKMEGIPDTLFALKRLKQGMRPAGSKGLNRALKYLLKETKKVTPKDKGELRKSGKVIMDKKSDPKVITGRIAFFIYYAIWVHENLENKHKEGTYAKFLERTVNNKAHQSNARALIAEEVTKQQTADLLFANSRARSRRKR